MDKFTQEIIFGQGSRELGITYHLFRYACLGRTETRLKDMKVGDMKKQDDPKEPLPNDPRRKIPVKPDINPDPTKKPTIEPNKTDPTRIEEPEKHDPTRIPKPDKEKDHEEGEEEGPKAALCYPLLFL